MIVVGLGVAIYFIVADAIDKKAENCLFKHFEKEGLLDKYNVTLEKDLTNLNYSEIECQSFVERAEKVTKKRIDDLTVSPCIKGQFADPLFKSMMLKGVMDRYNFNSTLVMVPVMKEAMTACARLQAGQPRE